MTDVFISTVLPVQSIHVQLRERLQKLHSILASNYANYEIVLIDDGCTPGVASELSEELKRLNCLRVLTLSRCFGEEAAIRAGLQSAIGDIVVVMEIGLDPVDRLPDMVQLCRNGHGIVVGVPESRYDEYPLRRLGSMIFHWLNRKLTGMEMYPGSSYFRAFNRAALNALAVSCYDRLPFRHATVSVGFNPGILTYTRAAISGMAPRPGFYRDVKQALDVLLTESRLPLSLLTFAGLLGCGLNAVYLALRIGMTVCGLPQPLWMSIPALQSGMFLLLFIVLTLLSEYLARALRANQSLPTYLVMLETNSAVEISDASRRNIVNTSE